MKIPIPINKILDLGCGTGRFTIPLRDQFQCHVIGVEPSLAMLEKTQTDQDVEFKQGVSESIPLKNEEVDLVWISQVFHHFSDHVKSLDEIHRILKVPGYLAIRNGSIENNEEIEWLKCFPEALAFDNQRIPKQKNLIELVKKNGFQLHHFGTIYQYFASSYREYYTKISKRGLSSLLAISDEAFEAGLNRLWQWVISQPEDLKVYEPIDFYIFKKV